MALKSPTVARLSKPFSVSLEDAMKQYRTWLDASKIQSATFKPVYFNSVTGFEIGFRTEDDAASFDKQFG
jgi:hypothetical protein